MPIAIARVILNSLKRKIAGTYGMTDVEHTYLEINKHILTEQPLTRLGGARPIITSAMQGIFGASLRDAVVMQHCQCVMCIYWNIEASHLQDIS